MPDSNYLNSRRRLWSILDGVNHPGCREKQDDHDQNWDDGPGQFNLRASIHLGWLAPRARDSAAEFHYDIAQ